jgi:type II secretory pathway component GspD/PulD (secretin)
VQYVAAADVAEVVKQVYAGRVDAAGGGPQQPRQPSPQEVLQLLRGGRGGNQRNQRGNAAEPLRLTIGVDARSNSLIVSAPEPLFQEVKQLVAQLDQAGTESTETVQTIAIKRANPQMVQQALTSVMGNKVTLNQTAGATTNRTSAGAMGAGRSGTGGVGQTGRGGQGNQGGQGNFNQGGGGANDVINLLRGLGGQGGRGNFGGGNFGGGSSGFGGGSSRGGSRGGR